MVMTVLTVQEKIRQYSDGFVSISGWLGSIEEADWQTEFDIDMVEASVYVGEGYDPYNHVGELVVDELIGVEG